MSSEVQCVHSDGVTAGQAAGTAATLRNASKPPSTMEEGRKAQSRRAELRAFLLLSVVMAPVLAVLIVSGYGLLVWMVQIFAGPPGH
jgi:nitrate reductase NapE